MGDTKSTTWTSTQAYVLAAICLVAGIAVGYLVRGSASTATPAATAVQQQDDSSAMMGGGGGQPTPDQMRHMAEKQAEPLLTQLKSTPNDPKLLAQVGNVYYDTQLYQDAVNYYQQSLQADPKNAGVRTDMGTAYWYMGNIDQALASFDEALKYEPNKATTLFNRGIVKWQGKMDVKGAMADWQQLLKTNPDYPDRAKVEEYMKQAEKHMNIKPGTKTDIPVK